MEIIQVDPKTLEPHPKNPRSGHAVEKIQTSIKEFGFTSPILIQKGTRRIIAGHGRWKAALRGGSATVPVIELDLTDKKAVAYMIADNRLAEESGWEKDLLRDLFQDLKVDSFDLAMTGFSSDELLKLFIKDTEVEDNVPEAKECSSINRGDLFILGNHRLMCGDSTNLEDVKRLLDGSKPEMCFTSPPYNLGEGSKLRGYLATGRNTVYEKYNDSKSESDWLDMMEKFTEIALDSCEYLFCNIQVLAGNRKAFIDYWHKFGNNFCDVAIWNKISSSPALHTRVMSSCFEFVLIFTKTNPSRNIRIAPEFRAVSNVYSASSRKSGEELDLDVYHGAVFPIHFPLHFIITFTKESAKVFDPFSGTGTTIIVCEKSNRKGFGMEIDPAYCDVIIKRWENFTGQKAEKINV